MRDDRIIFRPPLEARTPLLTVAEGCPHNRCSFCTMYRPVPFRVRSIEEVGRELETLQLAHASLERVFLVDGDAFALPAAHLMEIAKSVRAVSPGCKTIATYASIRNVAAKSDEELLRLKGLGFDDLHVGLETGHAGILAGLDKGNDLDEARKQLKRLQASGLDYGTNLMLGIGGAARGIENARATAAFLNELRPASLWIGTFTALEGSPLHEAVRRGLFVEASERENLQEERELIRRLEIRGVRFYGTHPDNAVSVFGVLPEDKELMIETIDEALLDSGPQTPARSDT